jgi:hypothetical protein
MAIIVEMTSRVIGFFPWGNPSHAGLHLIAIPYLLAPIAIAAVLFIVVIGFRRVHILIMLAPPLLMVFPTLMFNDQQMQLAWLAFSICGFLYSTRTVVLIAKRWA